MLTLLMATLAAAPESMRAGDALEALGTYGQVPECTAQEDIQPASEALGGHTHSFSPPRRLAALEGKATALIPFTRHADRRVVLRAARLLCFEGSAAAKEVLGALAARWPCELELVRAANTFGPGPNRDTCTERSVGDELALFASAAEISKWPERADPMLHAALTAQDPTAWEQVGASFTLIDRSRSRVVVKTLAALDDAAAIRRFLSVGRVVAKEHRTRTAQLFDHAARLALGAMAKKQGLEPPAAFLELLRSASPGDVEALAELDLHAHALLTGQTAAARALFQKPGTTPAGRGLLEQIVAHSDEARATFFDRSRQVDEWERNHDRPALRAFLKDEAALHLDRRQAARALARLGDRSGLVLWASSEGLTPTEYQARKGDLQLLVASCQGEVNAEAKKLLAAQWSR